MLEKLCNGEGTMEDIEKEIIKAIERKKSVLQNPTIIKQTEVPTLSNSNENTDQTNALHNSGYASSLAISTMTLITFISILIIYVLFCIIF